MRGIAEPIEVIGDLWDNMAEVPGALTLTQAQEAELDRRFVTGLPNANETTPYHPAISASGTRGGL